MSKHHKKIQAHPLTDLETELSALERRLRTLQTHLGALPVGSSRTSSVWEQIAPDFPDFDSLPTEVQVEIVYAVRCILDEYRQQEYHDRYRQAVEAMPASELARDLFGDNMLAELEKYRPGSQD